MTRVDQRTYRDQVHNRRSTSKRAASLWPLVAVGVLLAGAAALCVVGFLAVIENYDGVPSWINPVAAVSCCGATVLVLAAPLVWWLVREALRDR
jgi:hypothetical protein